VRREHRLDRQAAEQLAQLLSVETLLLERGDRILDAAGLRALAVLR
jgi:hypothetical protein